MSKLTETLGKRLTAQEVSEYLGVDAETVRRYYPCLGGIRLGRLILFFENLMIDAIKETRHAIQEKEKEQGGVDSRCDARGEKVLRDIRHENSSDSLGVGNTKKSLGKPDDPFGILEAD